tara:strand:- start:2375 stop:3637 length:1263 start_codon:yes stop_codon:yes gene_type:complete
MAFPSLTPTSTVSAITLPSAGVPSEVATTLAIGFYGSSIPFLSGAAAQVAYTYQRLGGDVLDIEIKASNVYNHYEEAVLEYSYIVNLHQARNAIGSALGGDTGSFDHKGGVSGVDSKSMKYPRFLFDYAFRVADKFGTESLVGGTEPVYSASFTRITDQQHYNLQDILSASAEAGGVPYAHLVNPDKPLSQRVKIRQIYYISPRQMWRFYGYYGGLNVVGNFNNYGQYSDDSTWEIIPTWQNKMQAIMYEDNLYTRTSHFSYEILNNMLTLYPVPDDVSPAEFWFRFTIANNDPYATGSFDEGIDGINNINSLPFENIPFINVNSMGQQWIRKFALALSKETLGQIRGKFGNSVPIPGDTVSLNATELLSQAASEQIALREELNKQLDETLYAKLAEVDKAMVDNTNAIVGLTPLKIFVG